MFGEIRNLIPGMIDISLYITRQTCILEYYTPK